MNQDEKNFEKKPGHIKEPTPVTQEPLSEPIPNGTQEETESTFLTGKRLWLAYTSVLLTILLVALDESIVVTALPRLASEFQALEQLTWVVSAFVLTQAGLLLFFGQVLTIVSSKAVFLFCAVVFEAGSLLCAVSPSMTVLILGRAIQGVGGSGLFLTMFAIIAQISAPDIRSILLGSFGSAFGISSILGPLLGGAFTDKLTWRWCFYVNLPFGALSLLSVTFVLPWYPAQAVSSPEGQTLKQKWMSLDWIGTILAVAMTVSLLFPLQSGGVSKEWNDPSVIALFITTAILFTILVLWERRLGDRAMMPLSILLRRTQLLAGLAIFTIMISNVIFTYYLVVAYQAKGVSAVQSGINIIPFMMCLVGGSAMGGWLNSATGRYTPYLLAGSVMCAIAGGLFFTTTEFTSDAKLIGYQILLGFGQGIALNQPLVAIQTEYSDTPNLIPQASAIQTYLWLLGAMCGISMAGAVFSNQLSKNLAAYSEIISPEVVRDVEQSVNAILPLPLPQQAIVIKAYIAAVDYVYLITVPASGLTVLAALFIKNRIIKKQEPNATPAP